MAVLVPDSFQGRLRIIEHEEQHDQHEDDLQYSTVQYSTVQYSTISMKITYRTAQYSTVQYSTVQYRCMKITLSPSTLCWVETMCPSRRSFTGPGSGEKRRIESIFEPFVPFPNALYVN